MNFFSVKRMFLAAAVFTFGSLGSVEWTKCDGPSLEFIGGDLTVTGSTASAGEVSGHVRRAPCILVRFYAPQQAAWVDHVADRAF